MSNLQELKSRIESIDKTASITKAMHRIAASKLLSAQQNFNRYQQFKEEFDQVLGEIVTYLPEHLYVKGHSKIHTRLYILITSDRGLAGGYHQQLFIEFLKEIKSYDPSDVFVLAIGKKGFYFAKKQSFNLINDQVISNKDQLSVVNYAAYVDMIEHDYKEGKYGYVSLFYNHFVNAVKQQPQNKQILPVDMKFASKASTPDFLYEGSKHKIFDDMVLIYLQSRIYGAMVDAKLSEFSARIVAMKQSTDNALEAKEALNLKYNQARQQKITNDLLDIINGK